MRLLARALFAFYLLILLWLVLFKLSFDLSWVGTYPRSLNLVPFDHFSRSQIREMFYNLIVFIPFGVLLGVNLKRAPFWRRLALVFMFSVALETVQFAFAIGVTDMTDVITNTCGGLLGLALYEVGKRYVDDERLDRSIVVAGTVLFIVVVFLLGILFSRNIRYHSSPRQAGQDVVRNVAFFPPNLWEDGSKNGSNAVERNERVRNGALVGGRENENVAQ